MYKLVYELILTLKIYELTNCLSNLQKKKAIRSMLIESIKGFINEYFCDISISFQRTG